MTNIIDLTELFNDKRNKPDPGVRALKSIDPETANTIITFILNMTLAEVRIGKPRRDALKEMVGRTNVPALTNFIGAIVQAEQLGVAIANVLEVQSEQLRIERRQRAEEMAAKAPIKMLFPLVGCIFPSMFIVILGPAMILIVNNL